MNERKVYSLNKIAWLISSGAEVVLVLDNNNKCYGIIKDDITDLLEEYKKNKELQMFLHSYQEIREFIKENKNIK